MLQRSTKDSTLTTLGFLVGVEVEPGIDPVKLENAISDALTWIEGTGNIDVTPLGIVPKYEVAEDARPE